MSTIYSGLRNDFTQVSNRILLNSELSGKAKSLYWYMCYRLSLSEKWEFSEKEILKHFKEKRDAMRDAKNELIEARVLVKIQTRNDKGFFQGNDYRLFAEPQPLASDPSPENPSTDKPSADKPSTENASYNNKDLTNKDYTNKDLTKKNGSGSFSNEKKWSVEEVLMSLDPKITRKIKESGRDLNDVMTKYVFWINKDGEPKKGFDVGFPAWFEKFFKQKLSVKDDATIEKEITEIAAKNNGFEEVDAIRKKIKSLLFHFPQQVANKLLQANINKNTENQWEIAIDAEFLKTKSAEEIRDFEELFAQIGVLIKGLVK